MPAELSLLLPTSSQKTGCKNLVFGKQMSPQILFNGMKAQLPTRPSVDPLIQRQDDTSPELHPNWPREVGGLWAFVERENLVRRTCIAVLHGLVMRASPLSLRYAHAWLLDIVDALATNRQIPPEVIENEARKQECGLPVLDPDREPIRITGMFGVVQDIENGIASLSMYVREAVGGNDSPVLEGVDVPVVDLPRPCVRPGAWVAWVERVYHDSAVEAAKGRFEPAGLLPWEAKPATGILYPTRRASDLIDVDVPMVPVV